MYDINEIRKDDPVSIQCLFTLFFFFLLPRLLSLTCITFICFSEQLNSRWVKI